MSYRIPDIDIPVIGRHRGVGLHAFQDAERLAVVRKEIDRVYAMTGADDLFGYAKVYANPPEARLFAGARIEALFELAVERRGRPGIDMDLLRAFMAGLDSLDCISRHYFCSLLDPGPGPGEYRPKRPSPLTDEEIEAAVTAGHRGIGAR